MELSFDTDQGRAMMRKLLTSHDQINQQVNEAKRLCDELTASNWQAPASTQFNTAVTGWTTNMKPTLTKLADARRRLELEIREWEQTAQDFEGDGMIGGGAGGDFGNAPDGGTHLDADGRLVDASGMIVLDNHSNMSDLAAAVIQLNRNQTPVRIVQTGPNEYAVLIAGTDGSTGGNNWVNAIGSGNGIPTSYQNEVKSLIEQLPKGATINLAGHSQGGLVALMLADDQGLVDNYHINSVTTFAASGNTDYNPRVGADKYHAFLTTNDPMRFLDANPHAPWPGGNRILPTPGAFGDPTVQPTFIPSTGGNSIYGGHSGYPDSQALKNMSLPFAIQQPWPTNGSGAHRATQIDNLTQSYRDLTSGDLSQTAAGAINMPVEAVKTGVNNFVVAPIDHAARSVVQYMPDPVRTGYDRASDWFENHLATGPTVTQAVTNAAGGAGEIVAAPFQGAWDVTKSLGNAGSDLFHGNLSEAGGDLVHGATSAVTDTASGLFDGAKDLGGGLLDTIL